MKKNILFIAGTLILSQLLFSCGQEPAKKENTTKEIKKEESVMVKNTVDIDVSASTLNWKANKLVGGHEGTFNFENGSIQLENNKIVGGHFHIDIASIKVTDVTDAEDNKKIVDHLLDPDFFDVKKFSKAHFTITEVKGNRMTGDLKMKDISKSITLTVKTEVKDKMFALTSDMFTINRTDWGIKYNSGSFFDAAKLGNYLIKDDVEMSVKLNGRIK